MLEIRDFGRWQTSCAGCCRLEAHSKNTWRRFFFSQLCCPHLSILRDQSVIIAHTRGGRQPHRTLLPLRPCSRSCCSLSDRDQENIEDSWAEDSAEYQLAFQQRKCYWVNCLHSSIAADLDSLHLAKLIADRTSRHHSGTSSSLKGASQGYMHTAGERCPAAAAVACCFWRHWPSIR